MDFEPTTPPPPPEDVEVAQLVPPPPPPIAVWHVLLATAMAIGMSLIVSMGAITVAAVASNGPEVLQDRTALSRWVQSAVRTPTGLLLAVLPGQVTFLLVGLGVAFSDSRDWRHRLGLLEGEMPRWTWGVLALATPTVALVSSLLMAAFREPSEHLKSLERMFTAQQGWRLGFVVLLVSVLPGICEELLFRGMLQRRLLIRWSPLVAILVSSLFFAAAHLDPMHSAGVLPLGLWLGIVAWRCNSLWPAMLCHVSNNALAILVSHAPAAGPIVLPISCLAMIAAIRILHQGPGKTKPDGF